MGKFSDEQVRDALRGAAQQAEEAHDSVSCEENKAKVEGAVKALKEVADDTDQAIKSMKGGGPLQ